MSCPYILLCRITVFLYLFTGSSISQWETGIGYSVKNQYPFNGLSVFLEGRLPYQGASFGINFRAAFEHFSEQEKYSGAEDFFVKTYNSNIDLGIFVNFFYRYIKPYAGLGMGAGNYSAEKYEIEANKIITNNSDKWKFTAKFFAGIKLTVHDYIQPFVQLYAIKYFSSLEQFHFNRNIKAFQLGGTAGLNFVLF